MTRKTPVKQRENPKLANRSIIATCVLQGLYSNIADAQKFAAYLYPEMPLSKALTLIAFEQADIVGELQEAGEI